MRKYLLHVLIISFVFLLAPTVQVTTYAGELEDAKEDVRNNPDDPEAHYDLGYAYDELGKYEEAIESYKQAIRINPDYADAHNNLGLAYNGLGMYKEAIEAIKQAIRINPDYAIAHYNFGLAYFRSGKYQEAIKSYKQAIRISPDFAEAHIYLGYTYLNLGMNKEAIDPFKQAIRIDPDDADAHFYLGYAYHYSNDRGSALEQYKITKSLDPKLANELFDMIYSETSASMKSAQNLIFRNTTKPFGELLDNHPQLKSVEWKDMPVLGEGVVVAVVTFVAPAIEVEGYNVSEVEVERRGHIAIQSVDNSGMIVSIESTSYAKNGNDVACRDIEYFLKTLEKKENLAYGCWGMSPETFVLLLESGAL